MDLRELLEGDVPLRPEVEPDWPDVVRRARPRARRRSAAGLGLAAALAAAAFATVALWPSGHGGVLQRALAAIGGDPIVHVVYREEAGETLVDLATGARTPLHQQHEEWYEADKGLQGVTTFDGKTIERYSYAPGRVPGEQHQTYAAIVGGFRAALANGTARLAGSGTIASHEVEWIAFPGEQLFDVADHRNHDWSHEVAVDRSTYQPVYVRETRDGVPGPGTGQEILSVDTLPAGSVDFTPVPPPTPTPMVFGVSDVVDVTGDPAVAARTLGRAPLWLGPSYGGHHLAFAQVETMTSGPIASPTRAPGVELCYGATIASPGPGGRQLCDTSKPVVLVQESTAPAVEPAQPQVPIPPGSVLVDWSGRGLFLVRDGLYVHLTAGSEAEAIAAAKALQEANVSR